MANFGINYLNACSGGLRFRISTSEGEINRRADTLEDGVYFVKKYGVAPVVMGSSDMDFASEEGFATNHGAKDFWNEILEAAA